MNSINILATVALGLFFSIDVRAQSTTTAPRQGLESVKIQSSAICDMCEKTIETEMIYEKGVKKVDVDLTSSAVLVEYDPKKTDADKLRAALIKLGYSADGTPGNAEAFAKLPLCCQKEGCGKLPEKE